MDGNWVTDLANATAAGLPCGLSSFACFCQFSCIAVLHPSCMTWTWTSQLCTCTCTCSIFSRAVFRFHLCSPAAWSRLWHTALSAHSSQFRFQHAHMATCAFRQTRQQPLRKCSLSLSLSLTAPYYATVLRVAMRSQARQSTEAAWQELTRTTLQSTRRQRLSLSPHCPHVP